MEMDVERLNSVTDGNISWLLLQVHKAEVFHFLCLRGLANRNASEDLPAPIHGSVQRDGEVMGSSGKGRDVAN